MSQLLTNEAHGDEKQVAKRPVHQDVYAKMRSKILFGDLAPGQAVTIQGLTEELNAGMTPVREAIRRLISDGALSMLGNRRVIVPELTESCIEQLDFMRQSMEPQLVRMAIEHMDQDKISRLRTCDDALNAAISKGDIQGYLTHNYEFHQLIYETAKAPILKATVDRLWLRFGPSLRVVCGRYGTLNLPDKHAELMHALEAGDTDAATTAIAEDVKQGMRQIREAVHSPLASQRFV